jgi:hypothetical protein
MAAAVRTLPVRTAVATARERCWHGGQLAAQIYVLNLPYTHLVPALHPKMLDREPQGVLVPE